MHMMIMSAVLIYIMYICVVLELCGCSSLETLTRPYSSTRATGGFKGLAAYAKCSRDSYESELGLLTRLLIS